MAVEELLGDAHKANAPFDWVLMDAAMPAPGGYVLAETMIKGWPRLDRLIMLLNANSSRSDTASAKPACRSSPDQAFSRSDLLDALILTPGRRGGRRGAPAVLRCSPDPGLRADRGRPATPSQNPAGRGQSGEL